MPVQFWREIVDRRLDWVEQPRLDLLRRLEGNEFQSGLASHEQITICLWGPAQVGKTTLLLKVLGVREGVLREVAEVLRGGRKVGNSSTSCPIRYHVSSCDAWFLGEMDHEPLDSANAIIRFSELREKISARRHSGELSVLDVYIPINYFEFLDKTKSISVIDLPGFDAADLTESEYVRLLAKKYLPGADLVLLVVKASNLSFLKGENLQLDELREWHRFPDKYRVVPTYSFSAGSFKGFFSKGENRTPLAVRKHLAAEILTFQNDLIESTNVIEGLIFPMEYGDSWESYKKGEGNLVGDAEAIISSSLDGIRESIKQSSGRLNRLRAAAKYHNIISSIFNDRDRRLQEKINELNDSIVDLDKKIDDLNFKYQKLEDSENSFLTASTLKAVSAKVVSDIDSLFEVKPPYFSKSDGVSGLQGHIRKIQEECRSAWIKAEERVVNDELFIKIPVVFNLPDFYVGDEFDYIGGKLKSYWADSYLWDSSYQEDEVLINEARSCFIANLRYRFKRSYTRFYELCVEFANNEEAEFKSKIRVINGKRELLICELEGKKNDLSCLINERSVLWEQNAQIEEETAEFILSSKNNFKIQLDENIQHLRNGDNVFYRAVYALLMIKEYKYIFEDT